MLIQLSCEERVVVPFRSAAVDAAVVAIPNTDQHLRISHRKVLEQYGMNQREDCCIRPNPQRQRQDRRNREPRSLSQLPQRKTHILYQSIHYSLPHLRTHACFIASRQRFAIPALAVLEPHPAAIDRRSCLSPALEHSV